MTGDAPCPPYGNTGPYLLQADGDTVNCERIGAHSELCPSIPAAGAFLPTDSRTSHLGTIRHQLQ